MPNCQTEVSSHIPPATICFAGGNLSSVTRVPPLPSGENWKTSPPKLSEAAICSVSPGATVSRLSASTVAPVKLVATPARSMASLKLKPAIGLVGRPVLSILRVPATPGANVMAPLPAVPAGIKTGVVEAASSSSVAPSIVVPPL